MRHFFLAICAFFIFLVIGCKSCKDDPIPLTCGNGFEPINDSCQCPEGKFIIEQTCRSLKEREYWAIMPNKYPCRDTILVEFGAIDTIANSININQTILTGNSVVPVNYIGTTFDYEKRADGDEFQSWHSAAPYCEINGKKTATRWKGKFINNDTQVAVKMYFTFIVNENDIVDSCDVVFKR